MVSNKYILCKNVPPALKRFQLALVSTHFDKPGKKIVVVAGGFPEKWPSFGIEKQKSFHCVTCACAIFFLWIWDATYAGDSVIMKSGS